MTAILSRLSGRRRRARRRQPATDYLRYDGPERRTRERPHGRLRRLLGTWRARLVR